MTDFLSTMSLFDTISVAGFAVYVTAYIALIFGRLDGTSYTYISMNLVAASLILISMVEDFNIGSAMIQITWIAISLTRIVYTLIQNGKKNLRCLPGTMPSQNQSLSQGLNPVKAEHSGPDTLLAPLSVNPATQRRVDLEL